MVRRAFRAAALLTAAALLLAPPFVCADEGASAPSAEVIPDEQLLGLSLEELMQIPAVSVTARKRVEDVQKIPISLTVIKGDYLEALRSGAPDVGFLEWRAPSLGYDSTFGRLFPRFYLRGLGNTDFDINASQPVSLVYDNVVHENPILKGFPVFDMDRIEVLRGPQGSLFGRNTPAGVIKFESVKPSKEVSGFGRAAYGSRNTFDAEMAVGGALNDVVSTRVSLLRQQRSNFIDNLAPGFEQNDILGGFQDTAGRFQFLFEPTNKLSALMQYHFRDLDGESALFRGNSVAAGTNDTIDGFKIDEVFLDSGAENFERSTVHGGSVTLDYTFDGMQLTSVSGIESARALARGDIDGGYGAAFLPTPSGPGVIPFSSETSDGLRDHIQFTQEIRLSSLETDPIGYQVGAFYFYEDLTVDSFSFDSLNGHALNGVAEQSQQTNAGAVFGTLSYEVAEDVELFGGLRYSRDSKDFSAHRSLGPFGTTLDTQTASPSDSKVSWDLSALYTVTDNHGVYARVARGFRAPSIQGRILFGDEITIAGSEELYSFEVGSKSTVWNKRGRINTSVFYYQMNDQQITAVGGGANVNRLINADRTFGYGAELDSEFALSQELDLMATLSLNHTEIDDPSLAVAPCAQCTITDPLNSNGQALIDGNPLPNAPHWIGNIAAKWSTRVGEGNVYLYTDWAYRSDVNFFLYDSVEFSGAYYLTGGLRAGYEWADDERTYEFAVFSRNLLDDTTQVAGIDFNNLTGVYNDGRFLGIEFRAQL